MKSTPAQQKPAPSKPVKEIRANGIKAAIWKNETPKGVWFNTTFERSYRGEDNEWKTSDSFGRDDLLVLAFLAQECFRWIHEQPSLQ